MDGEQANPLSFETQAVPTLVSNDLSGVMGPCQCHQTVPGCRLGEGCLSSPPKFIPSAFCLLFCAMPSLSWLRVEMEPLFPPQIPVYHRPSLLLPVDTS